MASLLAPLVLVLNDLDPSPAPEDVKAGWIGFGLFLILLVVIGLLGWSLKRHLRQVETNRRTGVFGDAPEVPADAGTTSRRA